MIETPYRIAPRGTVEHEFDLFDMGDKQVNFIMGFSGRDTPFRSVTSEVDTTAEDYDKQFREKAIKIDPPQRVRDFLDYQLQPYTEAHKDPTAFLDHFEYVILHWLEQYRTKLPNTAAARAWFNKQMDKTNKPNESDRASSTTINNITASNSNVQFQSPNATQNVHIGDEVQDARTLVQQLSAVLPEIESQATTEQFNEIKEELEFLKKKLEATAPSKTLIKTVKEELVKRLIGLPFDVAKIMGVQQLS